MKESSPMPTYSKTNPWKLVTFLGVLLGVTLFLASRSLAYRWVLAPESPLARQDPADLIIGTKIPVRYERSPRILLTKEESFSLTLIVARDIKNKQGRVIIPHGSQILGEIRPLSLGSRFFSERLLIYNQNQSIKAYSLNAISPWINQVETLVKGINPDNLLKGATLGEAAGAVIAALKGEQPLNQEILQRAGLEALTGWLLSGERVELLSIVPERDLTLTLESEFPSEN